MMKHLLFPAILLFITQAPIAAMNCGTIDPADTASIDRTHFPGACANEVTDDQSKAAHERSSHPVVYRELWNDLNYVLSEPGFFQVVGILGLAPDILRPVFEREQPEITEMWASGFADRLFEPGEGMGAAIYPLGISVLCLSLGRLERTGEAESFGSSLLRAQITNGILTVSLKGAVNRTRPDGAPYSYPSGHTSSAFTTAAVINEHFGSKWGIPAFIAATYVGLSRLQENKHYLSDIIAGAVLGSYVGFKISGRRARFPLVSVTPLSTNGKLGLSLSFPF